MNFICKFKNNFYWLPSSFMIGSAILKVINFSRSNEWNNFLGLQDKWIYIGIIEFISVIFFLFKPTMLMGFFMICTFWGGVIGVSVAIQKIDYLPVGILLAFALAIYWRKPSLFISLSSSNQI
jgi:hypothetical protein